jgi:cysteinyl-tRNA synthetase
LTAILPATLSVMALAGLVSAGAEAQTTIQGQPIRSWGYQLQNDSVAPIAAAPYDLVVVDYQRDPSAGGPFTAAEVAQMKKKPDGSRRIVLAYLSIGEAEDYRYYWSDRNWADARNRFPPVTTENQVWKGNYSVQFWEQEWQNLILNDADSYLNRVIDAGFDGVLLDKVDIADEFQGKTPAGTVASDLMIQFVRKISIVAKVRKKDFLVFAQNGEGFLEDDTFRSAIDGLAKEQLLFSAGFFDPKKPAATPKRNSADDIKWSADLLGRLKAEGKPVLVVEYTNQPNLIEQSLVEFNNLGFLPYFGPRDLAYLAYTKPAAPR